MATPSRRTGLKDVARAVGVSVNTASKALNNTRSNTHVAEETRRRILEVAKELGYQPNSAARSLVRGRADVVAMYLEANLNVDSPYLVEIITGAEDGCRNRRQSLLLFTRTRDQSVQDVCRTLLSGKADGIILGNWTKPDIVSRLRDSCVPLVHFPTAHPDMPSLIMDEAGGTRGALEYLAAQGHRRIIYRGFPDPELNASRVANYQSAAEELGIELLVVTAFDTAGHVGDEERGLLELPRSRRPTAIVSWNDEFAYRAILYCEDLGLKVPDDIAVVGFDGIRPLMPMRSQLTTVFVPWREIAQKAVGMLVDLQNGIPVPRETHFALTVRAGDTA